MTVTGLPQSNSQPRQYEPYRVTIQEYVTFREQGFLIVRNLLPQDEVQELLTHMDNLKYGREVIEGVPPPPADLSPEKKLDYWLRVHMLHRVSAIHERYMLHPRLLDVLEALIGPDVLALQTMLFFKQPGQQGQGYHQDSYYIATEPDTLCGAWLALDRADEENGCLWMTVGSQNEPIYPDNDGQSRHGDQTLGDIEPIYGASHTDESKNGLTRIARKYEGSEVPAVVNAGDVVFFGGHILHRSHRNNSATRSRRAFVTHYCNARSHVPWNYSGVKEGDIGNRYHVLARGASHLPYAQPKFGTLCAANQPEEQRKRRSKPASMMGGSSDIIALAAHADDDHDD